ncbi:TolC family protein [Chlorogloea sp. CCALA 695]|uniref:TolC family protein n=2 Tax=Chlorogloea sp. CCALA 695 TaxID=2107693 RepID=UPI001E505184|nr:TolC family protein [Chlorogloea sp. CCALA 695]
MKFSYYLVAVGTGSVIVFNTINSAMSQTFSSFQCTNNSCILLNSLWRPDSIPNIADGNKPIAISEIYDFAQSPAPSSMPLASPKPPNLTDILSERTPVPSKLNPSPNPLQFPTKPEEVRLEATEAISLQQALELARRNNRQLQVALLTLERSRANVREAQAEEYPTLNIRGGLNNAGSNVFSYESNNFGSSTGSSTALRGTAQLSYNVYTAGARTARVRAAEEQLRFDQLDVERLTEQLRLDVSNDYYDLQQADEQVRINRAAVTNAEASLRDAQALEQAGVGTRFDVLRSQVQLANANQNLTNALSQQQVSRRQLVNRLSLSQVANAIASDPVEIAGVWDLPLEDSIIQAFQNRAELQQDLVQRNISEQNRRLALASIKPTVAVSSNYNISDTFNDDESFGDDYSLGANVTWNLYDGGAAKARARAQSANIAIAETSFADTRNQVRFEVEQAYSSLQSNLANIQTASVALEQAREALRLARLRFQAGVGTQTDVISAENDLTQAEGNRVTAVLDYNRALASLTRAISNDQPR